MKKLTLRLSDIDSKDMLYSRLSEALSLPAYCGRNLDALHDVLTDIHEDTFVKISGIDELRESLGGYVDAFVRVISDSEEENPHFAFSIRDGDK